MNAPAPSEWPSRFGLLRRRTLWVPSWRLACILAAIVAVGLVALRGLNAFLSVTEPVPGSLLVVEGWMPDYALAEAKQEFERGHYEMIVTVGGPLSYGSLLSGYSTYAELAAASLRTMGLHHVKAAPAGDVRRNRTYEMAKALKAWLSENAPDARSLNVVSQGAHARRSRLIYQFVLGDGYRVGIISASDTDYEASAWWRYSEGFKTVLTEALAYAYTRLFFDQRLEGGDPAPASGRP